MSDDPDVIRQELRSYSPPARVTITPASGGYGWIIVGHGGQTWVATNDTQLQQSLKDALAALPRGAPREG